MRELRLIGVHDDGEHLLLTEDGDDRFRVPIDDALRATVRRAMPMPSADLDTVPVPDELRPRDVQALLRAGASVADVAERAGWSPEKVRRYEGPIRAERDHIAGLARSIAVSGGAAGRADTTFGERAEQRLDGRGVEPDAVVWDSWRGRDGGWTVLCSFPAGGRPRRATWHFDVRSRTLEPTDDEARWLGEDENSAGPLASARETSVYDVEAEGGLNAAHGPQVRRVRGGRTSATAVPTPPAPAGESDRSAGAAMKDPSEAGERPVDLVAAMRERSKNRRRKGRATAQPEFPEDAAPREQLDTSGDAPPVGSHPRADELLPTDTDTESSAEGAPESDTGDRPVTEPSVDELGHDPVTGTADLFADLSTDESPEQTEEQATTDARQQEAAESGETAAIPEAAAAETSDTDAEPGTDTDTEPVADTGLSTDTDTHAGDEDAEPGAEPAGSAAAGEPKSPLLRPGSPDDQTVVPDRPSSARKGRPSVPSWDDIMFGRRPGRD